MKKKNKLKIEKMKEKKVIDNSKFVKDLKNYKKR